MSGVGPHKLHHTSLTCAISFCPMIHTVHALSITTTLPVVSVAAKVTSVSHCDSHSVSPTARISKPQSRTTAPALSTAPQPARSATSHGSLSSATVSFGTVTSVAVSLGAVTSHSAVSFGTVTSVAVSLGAVTSHSVVSFGTVTSVAVSLGAVTSVAVSLGAVTSHSAISLGTVTSVAVSLGAVTSHLAISLGTVTSVSSQFRCCNLPRSQFRCCNPTTTLTPSPIPLSRWLTPISTGISRQNIRQISPFLVASRSWNSDVRSLAALVRALSQNRKVHARLVATAVRRIRILS